MERKLCRCLVLHVIGFLDLLAVSLVLPTFPVHIKSFGVSLTATGAITSIYGAIQLFSSPLIGKWSDQKGCINIMAICLVLSSVGYLFSAFYISSLFGLAILRILPGIFKHTQDLCRCCILTENGQTKQQLLGSFNAVSSVGFIIGPSIHGHLVAIFGKQKSLYISYLICATVFMLNFFIVCVLRLYPGENNIVLSDHVHNKLIEEKQKNGMNNHLTPVSNNFKPLKNISVFQRGVLASKFLLGLAVMMFRSSFVLWLTHFHPDLPSTTVGYMLSYNGFLGLFFGFSVGFVSNLKFYKGQEEKLYLHATYLVFLSFLLLATSNEIFIILIAMTTLTMGSSLLRVCGLVLTVKYLKNQNIGQTQGIGTSVLSVARFAAPLVSGVLQEFSFSTPNTFSLILSTASIAIFYHDSYLSKPKID